MTQQTKHKTFDSVADQINLLRKQYPEAQTPTGNISIEILFRVGPQATIKAAQERKAQGA